MSGKLLFLAEWQTDTLNYPLITKQLNILHYHKQIFSNALLTCEQNNGLSQRPELE